MNEFFNQYKVACMGFILGSALIALLKRYFNGPLATKQDLTGKVIIITGASDGIGIVTANELLKAGATVVFACRSEEKTKKIIESLDKKLQENSIFMKLDLSSFSSVKNFISEFKSKINKLDILINNAGAVFYQYGKTEDGIENTYQVNTFSHMYLTQELLPLLDKSNGRVINVASKGHTRVTYSADIVKKEWSKPDFEYGKKDYGFLKQYCFSKLGNVFFNQYLHDYIQRQKLNIKTVSLHPGTIHTEIANDVLRKNILMKMLTYIIYPVFWLVTKSQYRGAQTTLQCCYLDYDKLKSSEYYKDCDVTPVHYYADYKLTENRLAFIEWSRQCINTNGSKIGVEFKI